MKKLLIVASCVAFVGSVSAASAQFNGPPIQESATASNPDSAIKSNAKMSKKKMKKDMKGDDMKPDGAKKM